MRPFLLLSVLALLFLLNAQALLAELFAIHGRYILAQNDDAVWRSRDEVYARAQTGMGKAIQLQPANPDYLVLWARLAIDRCRYWDEIEQWQDRRQCFKQAQGYLEKALRINNQSAGTWTNVLLAKFYLDEFDEGFSIAMDRATTLGRYDYNVNRIVAWIGMNKWTRWTDQRRQMFVQSILLANQVSPKEIKLLADGTGRGLLYCQLTMNDPMQHRSCRKKKSKRAGGKLK